MNIEVKTIQPNDTALWDVYVYAHRRATLYHLSGWQNVITKTYGHKTYYLMAVKKGQEVETRDVQQKMTHEPSVNSHELNSNQVVGILPLVHLKHFLFGNSLISIPFFDVGGILADNEDVERLLLSEAVALGQKLEAKNIELRHIKPLSWIRDTNSTDGNNSMDIRDITNLTGYAVRSHKVRMLLNIPESSEILMKSFKAKLRSQIKKPIKEGLYSKIGSLELLEEFYDVFCANMRDLGSPVHSKKLIRNVLVEFPEAAKTVMIYKGEQPMACSMIVGFKETLENPWASALREYRRLSPNMLLYWTMLEYACDNGFKYFDFGRSTVDEGTYKFKEQWGAKPTRLHWHYISLDGKPTEEELLEKSRFGKAIQCWQKLPVPITRIVGPMVRKYVGL